MGMVADQGANPSGRNTVHS